VHTGDWVNFASQKHFVIQCCVEVPKTGRRKGQPVGWLLLFRPQQYVKWIPVSVYGLRTVDDGFDDMLLGVMLHDGHVLQPVFYAD
jgi:hypothetical protein